MDKKLCHQINVERKAMKRREKMHQAIEKAKAEGDRELRRLLTDQHYADKKAAKKYGISVREARRNRESNDSFHDADFYYRQKVSQQAKTDLGIEQ